MKGFSYVKRRIVGLILFCMVIVLSLSESVKTYAEYIDLVIENSTEGGNVDAYGNRFFLREEYYCLFVGEKQKLKLREIESESWDSHKVPKTTVISWSSMDKRIASVNKKGVVTAKKPGYTYIVATVEGAKVVCEITVVEPYLDYTSIGLGKGDSKQIKLIGSKAVSFDSSDKSIAIVDSNGIVTGKKYGTATITVQDNNNKAYACKVNVTKDVSFVRNNELTVVYEDGKTEVFDISKEKATIKDHAKAVIFGQYPQSMMKDDEITKEISDAKYDRNGNAVVDGKMYKRITRWDIEGFDVRDMTKNHIESLKAYNEYEYRSEYQIPVADDVYWSSHEFAYFKYDPIQWDIVDIKGGKSPKTLLMTHDVIDFIPCDGNTWENSSCRTFLNDEFIDTAFSTDEKSLILSVTNQNRIYDKVKDDKTGISKLVVLRNDNDTKDMCFLLSAEDMYKEENGFSETLDEEDYNRRCSPSSYAKSLGAVGMYSGGVVQGSHSISGWPIYRLTKEREEAAPYMLRSTGKKTSYENNVFFVGESGNIKTFDNNSDNNRYGKQGIRPAINISAIIEGTVAKSKKTINKIGVEQRGGKNTLTVKYKDGNWQNFNLKTDALEFDGEVEKIYFGRCFNTRCYFDEDDETDVDWKEVDTDPYFEGHKYVADVSGKKYLKIEGSEEGWQNGAWCCNSPIEWIPLKVEKKDGQKRILLMAKNIVEGCYGTNDDEKWESSKKRSVLNGLFYEYAFTKQERKFIGTNEIIDSKGKSIRDKVFILSAEEVTDPEYGFSSDYKDEDYARRAGITSYVMWSYSGMFDWGYCTEDGSIAHLWHLRPSEDLRKYGNGSFDNTCISVFTMGEIGNNSCCGIGFLRPVIWLKIEG